MNTVALVGNLTKDPELKTTGNGIPVCAFTVAVNRSYKAPDGTPQADFIACVAWRQTAEFVSRYFHKGNPIGITGSIQTRTYDDQNGQRRYITEVNVHNAEFVAPKAQNQNQQAPAPANAGRPAQAQAQAQRPAAYNVPGFGNVPATDYEPMEDADLPF